MQFLIKNWTDDRNHFWLKGAHLWLTTCLHLSLCHWVTLNLSLLSSLLYILLKYLHHCSLFAWISYLSGNNSLSVIHSRDFTTFYFISIFLFLLFLSETQFTILTKHTQTTLTFLMLAINLVVWAASLSLLLEANTGLAHNLSQDGFYNPPHMNFLLHFSERFIQV